MYFAHFGLDQPPFGITPNPAFFYEGSKRGEILEALIYAVMHGEGIVKVTGEVGSGKTMLCRMLQSRLPSNVAVIFLVNPTLNREEVLYAIAGELGLATGGKRADEVIRLLQDDLIRKHAAGQRTVLLIEEAQAMPLATLEEIRLFSNLETAHYKLLQIVLFGQPELDESLRLPRMRQLKERITHSFKVPPMDPAVIQEYLMFRMRAAGYRGPDLFTNDALRVISDVSQGIVRRISILADKSLLAAFAEGKHGIEQRHVEAAARDSEFSQLGGTCSSRKRIAWVCAAALVVAGIAGAVLLLPTPLRVGSAQVSAVSNQQVPQAAALPQQATSAGTSETVTEAPDAPMSQPPNGTETDANRAEASPEPDPTGQAAASSGPVVAIPTHQESVKPADELPSAAQAMASPSTPVPSATPSPQPQVTAPTFGLKERLLATRSWLDAADSGSFIVQLALADAGNPQQIERFLRSARTAIGGDAFYVYPSRIGGVPRYGIVHGNFASRDEAVAALKRIAGYGYRPQLRKVNGVRDEIQRSSSADLWP